MGRLRNLLKLLFLRKPERDEPGAEELRIAFKTRYHQFKLLLNANNKALGIMAEMEAALKGTWPFGMNFVRSRCTGVSTNVFQIAKHLNELAPGKYEVLYERFKEIQKKINPFIRPRSIPGDGPLLIPFQEVDKTMADQVGSKLANLGEISKQIHLKVPRGFVLTAQAYQRFMRYNDLQEEIDRRIQSTDVEHLDKLYSLSASIQQLIIGSPLPEDLMTIISEHYRLLEEEEGEGVRFAMRSSALGEDLAGTSFAGQYRSELNVNGENIFQAYKEVVASKYSLPAMAYRQNRGIRDEDVAMCVGCMVMVDALSGGVIYSRNPVNIRDDDIFINATWGLPKSVVDGSATSDLFVISRGDPMHIRRKEIPFKEQKFICYPDEGVCRMDVTGEESHMPSLSDEQALELARVAIRADGYYHFPQDMEWALGRDGSIIILQCRPLQQKDVPRDEERETNQEKEPGRVILRGGVTASPGIGAGQVYIVKKDMDALQFPVGGVLVTDQPLPRWAALLNRASAVVTGQGSIAGHLANVSREFGVPALFGLKEAPKMLKNGDLVTVDADSLRIYEGRIDSLLRKAEAPRNLMDGSPVFEALKGAAKHVLPLNLLDPDAAGFKPGNCRTFHDITRFCHEKAVHEMFQFGKEHQFPERSSKQLLCEVPMQWWVLNLDDGFEEEVEGKYVPLENIVSIPMLALWEGITAMPWEGPPPTDGRGLLSVMFEATANTALVPGMRSRYGNRNYFMISRNYCSLNSRLGFHFSTVETLVSDRSVENYINFQFKGGAADFGRRYKRVIFIKEILEEYGFKAEVKEDTIFARLENEEMDFMQSRLKILGFLTIHTRQLDMIMANDASLTYYRSKINKDIKKIINFHS
ncbi:MAG TPA: PEP/pyruvate-binding domain-containing protein [Acidobacteriota bacterium]|nr:PEP/pyruvate-binding domain-containing protein [Acidobacteriota bacterium]